MPAFSLEKVYHFVLTDANRRIWRHIVPTHTHNAHFLYNDLVLYASIKTDKEARAINLVFSQVGSMAGI